MTDSNKIAAHWFETLSQARSDLKPVQSLSDTFGNLSTEKGYNIQLRILDDKIKFADRLIGWKVGYTNKKVRDQELYEVTEPVFGWMTSKSDYTGRNEINLSNFCRLSMEAEIDFIMKNPLRGPGVTSADVIGATLGIMGAVELVGGRLKQRKSLAEMVADNSAHNGVILGPFTKSICGFDLRHEGVIVSKNGFAIESACGCEAMDNPINAVSWLANKLSDFGREIEAGSVISTGSLTAVVPLDVGDVMNISFASLGDINFIVKK